MMRSPLLFLVTLSLAVAGCGSGKTQLGDGEGDTGSGGNGSGDSIKDARFIADVFTWSCTDSKELYPGVYAHIVSLEYAPNELRSLDLPAVGECAYGLDMFPTSAGSGGAALDGVADEPTWSNDNYSGRLGLLSTGFWQDDVLDDSHTCESVEDRLEGGTTLTQAGSLTGVVTPEPVEMPVVEYDDIGSYLDWGEEVTAEWDTDHAWSQVWVQIRREVDGEPWESITCNVTGQGEFTVDDAIWDQFDESLNVDKNNLYVAFQSADTITTDAGMTVDVLTRAIDIAVVAD